MSQPAGKLGVSFGQDDLHILDGLERLSEKTRIGKSQIVRLALEAMLLDNDDAERMLEVYKEAAGRLKRTSGVGQRPGTPAPLPA